MNGHYIINIIIAELHLPVKNKKFLKQILTGNMKNITNNEKKKQGTVRDKVSSQETDEMEEMVTFIRKKRLQNQILKKATEK